MAAATKASAPLMAGADALYDFTYTARNSDGKKVRGRARAPKEADVIRVLTYERNLIPLQISGGPKAGGAGQINLRKSVKLRPLVITTQLLATMFEAGLPPLQALDCAIKDCTEPLLKAALTEVRIQVQNGVSMSEAMANQPVFPEMMINFARAGEAAGDLKGALRRIATQYDNADKLRAKVKKAMMQPMVTMVLMIGVMIFMLMYLVPHFTSALISAGGPGTTLPFLTQAVVDVSNAMKYIGPVLIVLGVPGWLWYKANKNKESVRKVVDPLKFKLPVFGHLILMMALSRFTRNLSGLLEAGVERLEALRITSKTVGSYPLEQATLKAMEAQRNGKALVEPLRAEPLFPPMVIQMVEVGEQSGQTGQMLSRLADIYDRDIDQLTDNLTEMIGPLMTVVMGTMVGIIVMAMFLPYLKLLTSIGN